MNFSEIKNKSKSQINGKIGKLILITLIYIVISVVASACTFGVGSIIIMPCMIIGYYNVYLKFVNTDELEISNLYSGFKMIWKSIGTILVQGIYIWLWSLLFIIPGIIKIISYAMTNYILIENPDISINEAISRSREMMEGNKMKYFLFQLSFLGWALLIPLTFGLISIYVVPYMQTANVNFYNSIKNKEV